MSMVVLLIGRSDHVEDARKTLLSMRKLLDG
jgi:hypothetical protein